MNDKEAMTKLVQWLTRTIGRYVGEELRRQRMKDKEDYKVQIEEHGSLCGCSQCKHIALLENTVDMLTDKAGFKAKHKYQRPPIPNNTIDSLLRDREGLHGNFEETVRVAASMFAIFCNRRDSRTMPTAQHEGMRMVFLKLSRMAFNMDHEDNYTDIKGYLALVQRERRKARNA